MGLTYSKLCHNLHTHLQNKDWTSLDKDLSEWSKPKQMLKVNDEDAKAFYNIFMEFFRTKEILELDFGEYTFCKMAELTEKHLKEGEHLAEEFRKKTILKNLLNFPIKLLN